MRNKILNVLCSKCEMNNLYYERDARRPDSDMDKRMIINYYIYNLR